MTIKTTGQVSQMLNSYKSENWLKSAELQKGRPLKMSDAPDPLKESQKPNKTFAEFLAENVVKVNNLQLQANKMIEKLSTGKTKNIHETLLAVEQADIAFRTMNQLRLKVLDTYKEIMRMQV